MKQKIKLTFLLAATISLCNTLVAQKGVQVTLQYNISTPINTSFKDYLNSTSTRGGQASILYGINNHIKVGLQSSFSNYYQKFDRQVYKTTDGSDISAVLSNTLQTIPLLAKGEYLFFRNSLIQPYIGLGAGIGFINFDQYIGEFEYNVNYTKAAFLGDVGIIIPFKKSKNYGGFKISTSYNLVPFYEEGIHHLDSWNVQAGVSVVLK